MKDASSKLSKCIDDVGHHVVDKKELVFGNVVEHYTWFSNRLGYILRWARPVGRRTILKKKGGDSIDDGDVESGGFKGKGKGTIKGKGKFKGKPRTCQFVINTALA